jgi:lactoylglutathione lyase
MSDRAFPIISVHDLPATRQFYEQLGFTQTYQFPPDGEPGFVTMERGESSIGIGAGGATDQDRFGYWVYVDDVDATMELLTSAGAPIVAEPADQQWGERVARTRDPDGNLVYLGAAMSEEQALLDAGGHAVEEEGGDLEIEGPNSL